MENTLRSIEELEGLTKEEMTEEEHQLKELVIDRIISIILHKGFGDAPESWSEEKTDKLLVFQEDIMMLCQYGAGFTLSRADDVRRAMGKKKMELMLSFKDEFIAGWKKNVGIFAQEIWDKMVDYAKYCFNKSHGVAYTLVTAKTAELCLPENKVDFMLFNYKNCKAEKKPIAMNQLLETNNLKFPTYNKPFEGIQIIGKDQVVEIKDMYEDVSEELRNKEYYSFADLFLENLPPSIKLKLICRGVYDTFTLDIKGLALLNKYLGKNATKINEIPNSAFNSKDLPGTLKVLKIMGLLDFIETNEEFIITMAKSPKARKDSESFSIRKGSRIGSWNKEVGTYRMAQLKKQFGIIKKNGLSPYIDRVPELIEIADKINEIVEKVKENNPGMKVDKKTFGTILKKVPNISNRFSEKKKIIEDEIFTGYVADKIVFKNGSCSLRINFSNNYDIIKFYTRNPSIIASVEKGQVIDFSVIINDTLWRGIYKVFTDIKLM